MTLKLAQNSLEKLPDPTPRTVLGGGQRSSPWRGMLEGSCNILERVLSEFEGHGGGPRVGGDGYPNALSKEYLLLSVAV